MGILQNTKIMNKYKVKRGIFMLEQNYLIYKETKNGLVICGENPDFTQAKRIAKRLNAKG